MTQLLSLLNTITGSLLTICVTMMATMGITLIFRTSNTTNFAQGAIAAAGTYLVAYLAMQYSVHYILAILIGLIFGIAFGLFIDIMIFRRGKNINIVGKQIITMGLVSIIFGAVPLIFGAQIPPQIPAFVEGNFSISMLGGELSITKHSVVCIAITAVVLTVLFVLLYKSKWGLGVRVTASSEYTAGIVGVNTYVITATSWAIAAALAVLAAVMLNAGNASLTPSFMTKIQVSSFLAGILGGFSTFLGPILGAIIIPLAISIVGWLGFVNPFFQSWSEVIVYILLLIAILIKPQGLFGKVVAKKV
ncbi:MAG: branched-chain amino acid ABC transporter permease [Bacilli bacterium]|jgi:branched-chain amino acid transport system permease protein